MLLESSLRARHSSKLVGLPQQRMGQSPGQANGLWSASCSVTDRGLGLGSGLWRLRPHPRPCTSQASSHGHTAQRSLASNVCVLAPFQRSPPADVHPEKTCFSLLYTNAWGHSLRQWALHPADPRRVPTAAPLTCLPQPAGGWAVLLPLRGKRPVTKPQ